MKKTTWVFFFHKYGKFWSILGGQKVERKPLFFEVWYTRDEIVIFLSELNHLSPYYFGHNELLLKRKRLLFVKKEWEYFNFLFHDDILVYRISSSSKRRILLKSFLKLFVYYEYLLISHFEFSRQNNMKTLGQNSN